MEFTDKLILIFFNSYKKNYKLFKLVELLGVSYTTIDNKIQKLIDKNYLKRPDGMYIELTLKSFDFLKENYLIDIKIDDLLSDRNTTPKCAKERLDITDIYIPKKFEKKMKWIYNQK